MSSITSRPALGAGRTLQPPAGDQILAARSSRLLGQLPAVLGPLDRLFVVGRRRRRLGDELAGTPVIESA